MSDYVKAVNFAAKDALTSGDPAKKVKGVEIDAEYNAIQAAVATKADKASPVLTGTPTAPNPVIGENSTVIPTTKWVRDLLNAYEPVGTIKAFAGLPANIPAGWAVCNGAGGTLNLTDRFIAGHSPGGLYGQNGTGGHTPGVGATPVNGTVFPAGIHSHGGVTLETTLTINQIPAHSHTIQQYNEQQLVGSNNASTGGPSLMSPWATDSTGGSQPHSHGILPDGNHFHAIDGTIASAVVPGFFALMFIQKMSPL